MVNNPVENGLCHGTSPAILLEDNGCHTLFQALQVVPIFLSQNVVTFVGNCRDIFSGVPFPPCPFGFHRLKGSIVAQTWPRNYLLSTIWPPLNHDCPSESPGVGNLLQGCFLLRLSHGKASGNLIMGSGFRRPLQLSRKGFCRNPRGSSSEQFPGEILRGIFGGFFRGLFHGKNRSNKSTPKSATKLRACVMTTKKTRQ